MKIPTYFLQMMRDFHIGQGKDSTRQSLMAEAYRPIMRGYLLPSMIYYVFVTYVHYSLNTGGNHIFYSALSLLTAVAFFWIRTSLLGSPQVSPQRLTCSSLITNTLLYANTVLFIATDPISQNILYLVLLATAFSMTSVSLRLTFASVAACFFALIYFASDLPLQSFLDLLIIGLSASCSSLIVATLLRRALARQIDARLLADDLARKAQMLADHDPLTGLANRRWMLSHVEQLMAKGKPFWFGIMDLDGFKSINDSYGHVVGDGLLCAIAGRMQALPCDGLTVGRLAGDEFAIVVEGGADEGSIREKGDALIAAVCQPCEVSYLRLATGASIGLAYFPTMADTADTLYERADYGLYQAKQSSRGRTLIFSPKGQAAIDENVLLQRALREADLEAEMYYQFQPQHNIAEGRILSFEALARWDSPRLGPVRPDKFIHAAERAGLIQNVTRVLFRKGLAVLAQWPEEISVSFNLSAQDVADRAFIFSLVADVHAQGINPARIEFEITETAVMSDIEASSALLQDLVDAGFKIALDDFGSGYSSFQYIDRLPLHKVKIDKSFVRRVTESATSREIVAGIISLCRKIDVKCVLEGVETAEELELLMPLKPEIIQGYLFGRPMMADRVTEQLLGTDAGRIVALAG